MRAFIAAALLAVESLASAQAPAPAPPCGATPAPPPAELSAWSSRSPAYVAAAAGEQAVIAPGRAIDAKLRIVSAIRFAVTPEKAPHAGSFGGMLSFVIEREGTYRVALGSAAWIDVVRDGRTIASTKHGHGPECTGIRKMVDFPLRPGRYLLQLSGNDTPNVAVLLAAVQ